MDDFLGGIQRGEMAADHFTIIANTTARDPRLHLADRGLLVDMMSHAKGFVITEQSLASRCADGITVVRTCLDRLRALGYIYRGKRTRYPKGSKNAKGKDISGALGPYQWYVTDKPEVIAAILEQVAREQQMAISSAAQETAGQDKGPFSEVVPTSANAEPVDNPDLPQDSVGSDDLRKQGVSADQHNLRFTTSVNLSTKEDQGQEEQEEDQGGLACGSDAGRAAPVRTESSPAAAVGGPLQPEFVEQPPDARAHASDDPLRWHGAGGLVGLNSPAARNARNAIVTGNQGPSWSQSRAARQKLDPATRAAVRAELAQRPARPPRAPGLPLADEQRPQDATPPDRLAR